MMDNKENASLPPVSFPCEPQKCHIGAETQSPQWTLVSAST